MKLFFGADYYPEHWPKERQETDLKLMQELGLDVVRLAEFSWQKLETSEGEFNFTWLDEIINKLDEAGIKVILGTPTAAPPAWLIEKDETILPMDSQQRRTAFGGRHHACQSNKTLRKAAKRYVKAFAKHFGEHKNVVGWQIDNELGNSHHDLCHCESCEKAFQKWLEKRYKTIDALNDNWGTVFWSQGYNSFDQVSTPKWLVTGHNPSQVLDWRRFHSDLILDFHNEQLEIIRELSPDRFLTHNMMGFADTINYYDLGEHLDFSSHDQYPGGHFRGKVDHLPALMAAELDMIRGTKMKPYWIMEQQSGVTGWDVMGRAPKPGQLGLWSMQTVAHGADAIVYFRWRTCSVGTEQYWHGILPHSGIPGRNYKELQAFIKRNKPLLAELQGAMPKNDVAMLFSYDQKYAMDIQKNVPHLNYQAYFQKLYNAFYDLNIPVDVIGEHIDFKNYKVLVAPLQYLMSEDLAKKLEAYVEGGGTLVTTFRSGVKWTNNINYTDAPLPGLLSKVLGIEVPEYDPLDLETVAIKFGDESGTANLWADIIRPKSANVLASYASDFYKGDAAVTTNRYGEGEAIYLGTSIDDDLLKHLVLHLETNAGIEALATNADGLEVVERQTDTHRYLFVMNHSQDTLTFKADDAWTDYFGDEAIDGDTIPGNGYRVFKQML